MDLDKLRSLLPKQPLHYKWGSFEISPSYYQVGIILVLVFLLLMSLARIRRMFIHWSLGRHSIAIFVWGFIVALIVEGFFILAGRTMFTEILGLKNLPKPISSFIDLGRSRVYKVLGESVEIKESSAIGGGDAKSLVKSFFLLDEAAKKEVKKQICK